jgi:hypothetical protein
MVYHAKMEKTARKRMMTRASLLARLKTNSRCDCAKKKTGTFIKKLPPRHAGSGDSRWNVEE